MGVGIPSKRSCDLNPPAAVHVACFYCFPLSYLGWITGTQTPGDIGLCAQGSGDVGWRKSRRRDGGEAGVGALGCRTEQIWYFDVSVSM